MKYLTRTGFTRRPIADLESVQGILELARRYSDPYAVRICFSCSESENLGHPVKVIRQLEQEGYIKVRFDEKIYSGEKQPVMLLSEIQLTVAGLKLLEELKDRSTLRKTWLRGSEVIWSIVTSFVTTIATLMIFGSKGP